MVLTHLILNGMIQVKGQLGEMAKCIEDPEPRISDLARLFFNELSTKENAIYNNLPDGMFFLRTCFIFIDNDFSTVISHLPTGDHAVEELVFQSTLRFIFDFIQKVFFNLLLTITMMIIDDHVTFIGETSGKHR